MTSEKSDIPQSPINEMAVLSIMLRNQAFLRRGLVDLNEEHFYRYAPVFTAFQRLHRAGVEIDAGALSGALEDHGEIDHVGGHQFIQQLWNETDNGRRWRQWVKDLSSAHARRISREGLATAALSNDPEQIVEIMRQTQEMVQAAMAGPPRAKTLKEAVALARIELDLLIQAGAIPGIPTGLPLLDELTGGMRMGQLWTILARTSRGKSVLLAQFLNSAINAGKKSVIFSAEMMVYEIVFRSVAHRGKIDMHHLMNPRKAGKGWLERIRTQLELLEDDSLRLWLDDSPKMTLAHVERQAMRIADANDGLDLVAVDYLQILKAERQKGQNREEIVANLSSGLKQLAKQLGCPVLTASQVNKDGVSRESEGIAFDSDVMLAIGDEGIQIQKARNGKRDELLHYRLNGALQTFEPYDPETIDIRPKEDEQADKWQAQKKGWNKGKKQ